MMIYNCETSCFVIEEIGNALDRDAFRGKVYEQIR